MSAPQQAASAQATRGAPAPQAHRGDATTATPSSVAALAEAVPVGESACEHELPLIVQPFQSTLLCGSRYRFAVLNHDHPFPHWDLLLEAADVCWTWRLRTSPAVPRGISAERITNHRKFYLSYSGPVSQNRGVVSQWDHGSLVWITARPDLVVCLVAGQHWSGRLCITPTHSATCSVDLEPINAHGELG